MREALAVQAFEEGLKVVSLIDHPTEYAMLQNNLGNALQYASSSHTLENNLRALDAYDEALKVRTREASPLEYANTIANKANCLWNLPDDPESPEAGNRANLTLARAAYTGGARASSWSTVSSRRRASSPRQSIRPEREILALAGSQRSCGPHQPAEITPRTGADGAMMTSLTLLALVVALVAGARFDCRRRRRRRDRRRQGARQRTRGDDGRVFGPLAGRRRNRDRPLRARLSSAEERLMWQWLKIQSCCSSAASLFADPGKAIRQLLIGVIVTAAGADRACQDRCAAVVGGAGRGAARRGPAALSVQGLKFALMTSEREPVRPA